ncbi:RNA polymerase sigma factor [Lacrimispora sp.]|uniref:RNA polymerase sigma factor n=1 Tax=Lacrimispora sp. TaxID=2719234 RepID=UPI0028AE3C1E|nr:sigma-70 family RNA polymerase sigma factor [Lacrimispora sp.]
MRNKQDNREMIERLCADTWRELYRFIYYKVQNREEAEDITQETYVKAISFLNRNDVTILECKKYLKFIAMNVIRDQWRAKKRRSSINIEDVKPEEISLEDFADSLTEKNRLEEAMNRLTKEQHTVIELRIIKGYTVAETAKLMQKKEGAVRVLQLRAVKALAKLLETEQGKEER